ncbi:hypothetical protein BOX15_Mlig014670g1, partial [Macrostomum lignano]
RHMQSYTAGSVELARISHGNVHMESQQPVIVTKQKVSNREQFFMAIPPILMIWSGLILLFEVITIGFRRNYAVYGSGIWVGLSATGFSCLLSASLGRSSQSWSAGLTAGGSALLAVLAAGLAVAGFELHRAKLRLSQPGSCAASGKLVMAKCAFQLVGYAAFAALAGAVLYRTVGRLCSAAGDQEAQIPAPETKDLLNRGDGRKQPRGSALATPSQPQMPPPERRQQPPQPKPRQSIQQQRSVQLNTA